MRIILSRFKVFIVLLFATHAAAPVAALDPPKGDIILTITGAISVTNGPEAAEFDKEVLAALGAVTFKTRTVWTDGVQTFTGVELSSLLTAIGARGSVLRASAVNDYSVDIPVSDAVEGGPIVAYALNGAEMSLRNRGPLWIVYPFDSSPDYQTELIYSRSIWQLDRIEVLN